MSGKKIWQNTTLLYDKNYKPTCSKCVKTMFYGLNKDTLINETEESPEIDPHIYSKLIYNRSTNVIPLEKEHLVNK